MQAPAVLVGVLILTLHYSDGEASQLSKLRALKREMMEAVQLPEKTHLRQDMSDRDNLKMLASKGAQCKPGQVIKSKCTVCVCKLTGVLECTKLKDCRGQNKTPRNRIGPSDDDRVSALERNCTPGDVTKVDCNRCICVKPGLMMCSLIRCDDPQNLSMQEGSTNKKLAKYYCTPGEVIDLDCNKCLCTSTNGMACTQRDCSGKDNQQEISAETRIQKIGAGCNKGDVIIHSCNRCICYQPGNMVCTRMRCEPEINMLVIKLVKEDPEQILVVQKYCRKGDIIKVDCNSCGCERPGEMICTQVGCRGKRNHDQVTAPQNWKPKIGITRPWMWGDKGAQDLQNENSDMIIPKVFRSLEDLRVEAKDCIEDDVMTAACYICKCIGGSRLQCLREPDCNKLKLKKPLNRKNLQKLFFEEDDGIFRKGFINNNEDVLSHPCEKGEVKKRSCWQCTCAAPFFHRCERIPDCIKTAKLRLGNMVEVEKAELHPKEFAIIRHI